MAKAELKRALVTKRLAILQDDADDHEVHHDHILSESDESPITYKRRKRSLVISDDEHEEVGKLELPVQPMKKKSKKSVVRNDELDEVGKLVQPTKKQSRKRSAVMSDDESEEVEASALLVQFSKKERTKRKRVTSTDCLSKEIYNSVDSPRKKRTELLEPIDDSPSSAMKRAEEVRTNLPTEYPSFAKIMLPSHVSRVFWLHLPSKFSKEHLPKSDSIIELIDEDGMKFECNYLVHKSGLSGGWRGFSLEHDLNEGDVVVFQLIAVTTFKVFIVRNDSQDGFQGVLGLLTLDDCKGNEVSGKTDNLAHMLLDSENSPSRNSETPSTSSDNVDCEVLDGICFSDLVIDFEAIKSFENFRIIVDGLVVDSKFSDANRKKYYDLCCSQKSFLHEQLLKGLNCNLVVGIIMETVNIADAIRACTYSTSIESLQIWENTLKAFEVLGMKVNFLRAKLNLMLGNMGDASNGMQKCIDEQACAAKKMKGLETKLTTLKSMMEKINLEIEAEVAATAQKLQSKLTEIAHAPW